MKNKVED